MKKIALLLAAAMVFTLACDKTNKDNNKGKEEEEQTEGPISIDGNFDDWASLKGAYSAKNSTDSQWEAVREIRVYAYGDYVYYYVRFDKEYMKEYFEENDVLPARVNLNTDGEFTSGYQNYFTQGYDFMIEFSLGNGAGGWGTADNSTLYQRLNGDWTELLGENSGLTFGAGSGNEFELFVDRSIFNKAVEKSTEPMPMGDNFQTSMRFYETTTTGKWEELSNMPNSNDGYGPLLDITFAK
jgi:hypothetical protein